MERVVLCAILNNKAYLANNNTNFLQTLCIICIVLFTWINELNDDNDEGPPLVTCLVLMYKRLDLCVNDRVLLSVTVAYIDLQNDSTQLSC